MERKEEVTEQTKGCWRLYLNFTLYAANIGVIYA